MFIWRFPVLEVTIIIANLSFIIPRVKKENSTHVADSLSKLN